MATQVQLRRGTAAENNAFTGAQGEVTVDTTNDTLRVHDGSQAGGYEIAKSDSQAHTNIDINSGTIDGVTLGTNSAVTEAQVDNININGNAITSTDTNGNIALTPDGTGEVDISKVDIDGGTIDSTTIGGSTPAAGSFTTVSATGDVDIADKIVHTGDTNTAIRFPAADTVTVETGGSEAMRIDSSGLVGIGTTSPARSLHVASTDTTTARFEASNGDYVEIDYAGMNIVRSGDGFINNTGSSGNNMQYRSGSSGGHIFKALNTERMRIDSSGNVGIGTSSPSSFYSLADNLVIGTGSGGHGLTIYSGSGDSGYIGFNDTATGSMQGFIQYNHNGDYMAFAPNGSEKARIDSSGLVGIGTSSPSSYNSSFNNLVIAEGSNAGITIATPTNGLGQIAFADGTTGDQAYRGLFRYDHNTDHFAFFTAGTNERMRIDSSGNVGIGTTSPSQKLSVSGNVTITGSLSKGSGSFKIDHPIKPETHHLVHSFIEGPQADNIYRGKVNLVAGSAMVNIDSVAGMTEGTFVGLNGNVQCFTTNESGWTAVRGSVSGNILTIEAQDNTCTDTISWMVVGERHDQHMIDVNWTDENGKVIVEPLKETENTEED